MEWLFDPNAWLGLITLVVLEIVLGIDNLVFIAILTDRADPRQRDRVRIIGLSLALLFRLALLSIMAHLVALTRPVFTIFSHGFSIRDIILTAGGLFLLWKATTELHEKLEGVESHQIKNKQYVAVWILLIEIVVLDMVFSLDSIITAIGMVEHLYVMVLAIIIGMIVMMWASKAITLFVNKHPTVVMLCLSFLLMIGFSLIAEGLGYKIPKGYLYAAIGFSILIEFLNQMRLYNLKRHESMTPFRDRTAQAILNLLGDSNKTDELLETQTQINEIENHPVFAEEEKLMVSGVLSLGQRSVVTVMTPQREVDWIDIQEDANKIKQIIIEQQHSRYPVCTSEGLDSILGIGQSKDLLAFLEKQKHLDQSLLKTPLIVPETLSVLKLLRTFRQSRERMALVSDEYGSILGLVTTMDLLEAIAGEFPDKNEQFEIQVIKKEHHWVIDGRADLHTIEHILGRFDLVQDDDEYSTLAGLVLDKLGQLPEVGQIVVFKGLRIEVLAVENRRIVSLDVQIMDIEEMDEVDN